VILDPIKDYFRNKKKNLTVILDLLKRFSFILTQYAIFKQGYLLS